MNEFSDMKKMSCNSAMINDVDAATHHLYVNEKHDRKLIVESHTLLSFAVEEGDLGMITFLVRDCQANIEQPGRDRRHSQYPLLTPLWRAANKGKIDVVKLLVELGADVNSTASDTGSTPLYGACDKYRNMDVIKFLVSHGADIDKPINGVGTTCLMRAIRSIGMSKFFVDQGADVNRKDSFGNTALHLACDYRRINAVRLLVKYGADPSIKNNEGNDVFQETSLQGQHWILDELVSSVNPPISRQIEYYQLLGAYHVDRGQIPTAMSHLRTAVQIRESNSYDDIKAFEPNPVYMFVQEVNTMEELERLGQNHDMLHMYALMVREQILGPGHKETIRGLLNRSVNVNLRQGIGLQKYAFQLRRSCLNQFIGEYFSTFTSMYLKILGDACTEEFKDILDFIEMVTLMTELVENPVNNNGVFQRLQNRIFDFLRVVIKMSEKQHPGQTLAFRKVVYRLIKIASKNPDGCTLLHVEVGRLATYGNAPEMIFQHNACSSVELLLECGANVNAVDNQNNTALHLCTQALSYRHFGRQAEIEEVILILLKHSAHVDMVNNAGNIASEGLNLNMLNYVSLKCLASTVIMKHRIPYVECIPGSLKSFVEMHGPHGAFASKGNLLTV